MYKQTIYNINNNFITYYGPDPPQGVKINAILLGDSWVDCLWKSNVETWPFKLCLHKKWTYINIAKAGTKVSDMKSQIKVLNLTDNWINY